MDDVGLDRKIVIVGATDVGKTSITMRYCHGSFSTPTSATIGASFLQKRIVVSDDSASRNGGGGPPSSTGARRKMTLQIWDTAGQERFRSMAPMYYRNAKAAILVFDVQKPESFEKIKEWLQGKNSLLKPQCMGTLGCELTCLGVCLRMDYRSAPPRGR